MLRITVELLPGGRESGAVIVSRGALPITKLAGLTKAVGSAIDPDLTRAARQRGYGKSHPG